MGPSRRALSFFAALVVAAPAMPQVPPQVLQAIKPVVSKLAESLLKPKMQVESFSLGGFKATRVEPDGDATPEKFNGSALFELPQPLGPRKLDFKNLVLKGGTAEGTLDAPLKDFSAEYQHWTYHLTKVVLSDKGSRVEGTATLAGLKLDVGPLILAPQGLQGTLTPGDLPLAEGAFTATLLGGEVTFSAQGVRLKGNLEVVIALPVRHGATGEEIRLDGGTLTLDSALLVGSGVAAPALVTGLPLLHKGQLWQVQKLAFAFERGTPLLSGPTRLQFPLNVFCRVGATDQPYLSEVLPCSIQGRTPAPSAPVASGTTFAARRLAAAPAVSPATARVQTGWEGFSGSFALPAASLHPSGLTTYRVDLEKGTARVEKGVVVSTGTALTGRLSWGPAFTFETSFKDAPADLSEGLYVQGSALKAPAEVGAYRVYTPLSTTVCDFSTAHSPEGLPETWMGVYIPVFQLSLPIELFTLNAANDRLPVLVVGKAGRFEGNGTFSGSVGVQLAGLVNLHIAPVHLEPFDLHFNEGALLNGPLVTGQMDLTAPPLLEHFNPGVTFRLTQNGAEQVEINTQTPQGAMAVKTHLPGVIMVMAAARLNPTNMDFTGRFDFAIAGAAIPSTAFDHLVLEASGAGIDGSHEPLSLDFKGSRWSTVPDHPQISLWGYPLGLGETGYGVLADGRFYVGLGGDMEINPIIPSLYNRLLFTTEKGAETTGTVELENPYKVDQSVASLGSFNASLGFEVKTADDVVSDAYFLGDGDLKVNVGDTPFGLKAGLRFGRSYQGSSYFPYFYALGHFEAPEGGIPVAPNLEVYGLVGGLSQNFLPDEIRNTTNIQGKPDSSLGLGIMAGVDAGTSDNFTFHGGLDLYISQNLTTLLQGKGWLYCGRDKQPDDNVVTADIRFTRNPNTFHATLAANLTLCEGMIRPIGQVELHFAPDKQYVHIGTKETPITVRVKNAWDASGYVTADFANGVSTFGAGAAFSYSKEGDFGIIWGNAWLNAQGDLIIEIDGDRNPRFLGTLAADGGASFGMQFKTFWHNYKITIFSGSIAANLALQAPGSPTLSGAVSIHYSVLGGAFSGSVGASLDM
jgi:hypothetical protein